MTHENPKEPFKLLNADEPHLKKIPERLIQALRLAHAGNSYEAVAAELNIPLGTVKSRISRARERIIEFRQVEMIKTRAECDHMSTFSFGCTPGVTRCDKCGKMFGLERALKGYRG